MKRILITYQLTFYTVSSLLRWTTQKNPLSISGYIETYYAYDFGNPDNHNRPGFVTHLIGTTK
jgi:hypothetical protein